MKKLLILAFFVLAAPGCAISQLRRSSSKIGVTVDDVITQQVLDNLAKFKQNPNAIPHFAYPAGAQSTVRDSVSASPAFDFTRSTLRNWGSGFGMGRDDSEGFTMQPVTDPYKLNLMRCLYQQAVCSTSPGCSDCVKRYNNFYFGTEEAPQVAQTNASGQRVYWWSGQTIYLTGEDESLPSTPEQFQFNPPKESPQYVTVVKSEFGEDVFFNFDGTEPVLTDEEQIGALLAAKKLRAVYIEDTLAEFTRRTGRITPACLSCGWLKCGDPDGVKNNRCCATGEYCGSEVWVPANCRDQLSILTLLVLEIARHDPAVIASESTPDQHEILLTLANTPSMVEAKMADESGEVQGDEMQNAPEVLNAPFQPQMKWNNLRPRAFERQTPLRFNPLSGNDGAVDAILNERARETLVR